MLFLYFISLDHLGGRLNFDIQFVKINIRRCISIYILVPGTRATQCAGYYSRLQRWPGDRARGRWNDKLVNWEPQVASSGAAAHCWLVSPVTTLSRAKWLLCWYKHHHLPQHCKLSTWKQYQHSAIWRRLSTILPDSARQASIGSEWCICV